MKAIKKMTNAELAAFVQSHLQKRGIKVILSGGACVAIYSSDRYVSQDLDLVNIHFAKARDISAVMEEIGFQKEGRHFKHPDNDFFVEFPPGPLSVGEEPITDIEERKLATGILRIISPTECVKDRLAAYYHWDDLQCLEQASLVAQMNEIDLKEVERWSKVEGKIAEFRRIRNRLLR